MSERRQVNAVFVKEQEVGEHARRVISDPPVSFDALMYEYQQLSEQFHKLLRQSRKMTRLADSGQNKLIKLKNRLEEQNQKIEEQHEALIEANKKLEEASLTDSLTGLRNRRFLNTFLAKDIDGIARDLEEGGGISRNFLLMMLDVDHFKLVNDNYGHSAGDMVLKQIAGLISNNCRRGDIPVRWGGEEFLMVCRDADRQFAPSLAERLRKQIECTDFDIGEGRVLNCTASIGFAFFPFFSQDPFRLDWERVVDLADQGLYAAKRTSRNAWVGVVSADDAEQVQLANETLPRLELLEQKGLVRIQSSLPEEMAIHWH
ncbi:MAG: GGDEF domain-containing protein [Acidobacteriota bacterium]|nr:GGDEF domain-containing protein [Acidobacteriota bacterium]